MKARPLALIAKVLGRKYDVTVTIAGQPACTSGKNITIPVVSGDHAEALAHGYIDHEAAHVRYTDFTVELTNNFAGDLLNILEDVSVLVKHIRNLIPDTERHRRIPVTSRVV